MKKIFLLISFFFIIAPQVFSHPHIFIDLCIEIDIDEKLITGFWENWIIIREFGKNIRVQYDRDNDGYFHYEETDSVKHELFENISKYNYYTYLNIADDTYSPSKVHDFSVKKGEETAVFRFFIPCRTSATDKNKICKPSIIDWSKYVSFGLRYIENPTTKNADYIVRIERLDDYFSHSSIFGNAAIVITMKEVEPGADNQVPAAASREQLIRLPPENEAPIETIVNQFIKY